MKSGSLLSAAHCCAAALAIAAVAPGVARSAEFDYQAKVGLGTSDNIRRDEVDKVDEDIAGAGVTFSIDQRGSRLQADVIGDLAYYEYLNDTFDSEVLGNFIADTSYAFVPERFTWVLNDDFGQVLGDPFSPATPDNRENINYLVTGPDLTLPLGSQTRIRIGARYGLTTYEHSPFDSESVSGGLALIRLLSSSSSLELHANTQDVKYDEETFDDDYTQSEAFLRYAALGSRTELTLDVGYMEIDRDAAAQKEDGTLVRLSLTRRISEASTVSLSAGEEFASAGSAFASSHGVGGVSLGTSPGRQTTLPFTNDYARISWDFRRNRTGTNLYFSWGDQSYEDNPQLDQTILLAGAVLDRDMSQTTSLQLHAGYTDAQYDQPNTDYQDLDAGVRFSWRLTSAVTLQASYVYSNRSSEALLGDYTENRFWLSIGYGRGLPRSLPAGPAFPVDSANR